MIIITGASGGVGCYLIKTFLEDKVDVIGLDLDNSTTPKENFDLMYKVDICKPEEIKTFIGNIEHKLTNITLVNCAGINYNTFAHKADPAKWANLINVNLVGTFNMINALLPAMREQNYGRIINFSSIVAQTGVPGTSAYAASKAGLWGMTRAIAVENATNGITINNLNLGYFNVGMIANVPLVLQDKIKQSIPSKKFGEALELYKAVKFLMNAEYVTGTSIDINGGLF